MSDKKAPLVSVIITNYNYAQYVGEAIESVLNQTYKNLEIIVIDDGSTDDSDKIIGEYAKNNKNIRYIKQKNQGVVYVRNKGIRDAKGDFFIFIDADDTIPKNFIEKMYETLKQKKADVTYCDLKLSGKLSGKIEVKAQSIDNFLEFKPTPICQLVKVSIAKNVEFDKNLNHLAHEDNDFFFRLYLNGAKFAKAKTYYNYRIHGAGRSPGVDTKEHYEARIYLYDKYKDSHPKLKNPLVDVLLKKDEEIKKWHKVADERFDLINGQEKIIKENDAIIKQKDQQMFSILSSKQYKIGRIIASPVSVAKSLLRKVK